MNGTLRRTLLSVLVVLTSGMLSGCAAVFDRDAPPITYYLLSPVLVAGAPEPAGRGPVFAVARVRLPDYLNQKGLVTRIADNELKVADNDQWAGPLAGNIANVLSENISLMIPSDRVVELPVSAAVPVDYEVRLEVMSFEGQPDGSVDLAARWTVFGEGGRRLIAMQRSGLRTANVADGYPAITAAMSGLLAELSREIADTLRTLSATPLS